jgi:archaeal flagellar protein FlaJ
MFSKKPKGLKKPLGIRKVTLITTTFGFLMLALNSMFLIWSKQLYTMLNTSAAIIILGVPLAYRYSDYNVRKNLESIFPIYLKDIAANISAGMTLPQAMRATHTNNYGQLTPYVRELSAKISWGVPFEKAMHEFASKTRSKSLSRTVSTIIETHRSGGQIDSILVTIAQSLHDLEKIKKERSSSVYGQMINGYLIYLVFLGVMVGMSVVLIPAFKLDDASSSTVSQEMFTDMFRWLTLIQGFFAGLSIGKMAEGTLIAGFKHAMVLCIIGYSSFMIFV